MRIKCAKHLGLAAAPVLGLTALAALIAPWASMAAAPARQDAQAAIKPGPSVTSTVSLTLDPTQSKVHYSVPSTLHAVHGTFALTRGTMNFDPESGKASGEIVVNAKSGESGNNSRDARMHREILETAKFPEAVFHPSQVEGKVSASGPCEVKVRGTFSVHGSDHEITALVHAELRGDTWKGSGKFDVPYVQWGIKDPSNFLLKVNHVVSIEIEMSGSVQPAK